MRCFFCCCDIPLQATDADNGIYGEIYFNIVSGNEDGKIWLNSSSGELFLVRPLVGEGVFELNVVARNPSGNSSVVVHQDTASVKVHYIGEDYIVL